MLHRRSLFAIGMVLCGITLLGKIPRIRGKKSPVAAVLMVKNEALVIEATLRPLVEGGITEFLIYDTGSTDNTLEIVKKYFGSKNNKDVHIIQEPFIDFAQSRNRALELAEKIFPHTPFFLMPDAEWYLENTQRLIDFCEQHAQDTVPVYLIPIHNERQNFYTPRLLRNAAHKRFVGVVHEMIDMQTYHKVPDTIFFNLGNSKAGVAKSRKRWERDVHLLAKQLEAVPDDPRTLFYLGETYAALGVPHRAYHYFKRRTCVVGWPEETYLAWYRLARIIEELMPLDRTYTWQEAQEAYLMAVQLRPHRIEPLICIAYYYWRAGNMQECYRYTLKTIDQSYPQNEINSVDKRMYNFTRYDLLAACAGYLKEWEIGEWAARKALESEPHNVHAQANLASYLRCKNMRKSYELGN